MTREHGIDWENVKQRLRQSQHALDAAASADEASLRALYRQRTVELASRATRSATATIPERFLVVAIGSERYGLELDAISEIAQLVNCTAIPGSPPQLMGVTNLLGEIHSVVDLGQMLGISKPPAEARGYVVLVRHAGSRLAVRVDQVETVESFPADALVELDNRDGTLETTFVRGVSPGKVIMLDIERLLTRTVP